MLLQVIARVRGLIAAYSFKGGAFHNSIGFDRSLQMTLAQQMTLCPICLPTQMLNGARKYRLDQLQLMHELILQKFYLSCNINLGGTTESMF